MKIKIIILVSLLIPSAVYSAAITLQERRDMRFATVAADPAGDVITIDANGNISAVNASLLSGRAREGQFRARGDRNTAVTISFSSGDVLSGPGTNMSLGSFTHNAGATPMIGNNKQLNFNVGASLTINPIQLGGDYSGTYSVFVDYQ